MGAEAIIFGSLGLGGIGAFTSYEQARRQNAQYLDAAERSAALQNRAIETQQRQIVQAESLEARKLSARAHQVRSRLRVAAGESGLGLGGTYENLLQQTDYEEAVEREILSRNALANIAAVRSRAPRETYAPNASPLMTAMSAGLNTFAQGLQIGSTLQQIGGGS